MNTDNELFGELHEQEEYGLFGNEHRRQHEAQQEALRQPCVSVSKIESFVDWLKEQKHEIRGGKKMYDVRYYRYLTEDEMYEYWSQRVYSR